MNDYRGLNANPGFLLIVDYNLTRFNDVAYMANYARRHFRVKTLLIRPNPTQQDHALCDEVIDLDPLAMDFVEAALRELGPRKAQLRAGIVFSDNAVYSGALLLKQLGLPVDSAVLAEGAFDKYSYRRSEARHEELFIAQGIEVPDCKRITRLEELQAFAARHPQGFVVKPTREGNNRGVVMVNPGDSASEAFDEVRGYLAGGVICEERIVHQREFSFDGVGSLSFITEKVSANGRYPVETAQILPANLNYLERATLNRAGALANLLVGQRNGPFHNEIKLSADGLSAAVVEPNRRPAGMHIWTLAREVYGIDLYGVWIDAVFGNASPLQLPTPICQAATLMLGVLDDGDFAPAQLPRLDYLMEQTLAHTLADHALAAEDLRLIHATWLNPNRRRVHCIPRDNSDFSAQACLVLERPDVSIHRVVHTFQSRWLKVLIEQQDESLLLAQNLDKAV